MDVLKITHLKKQFGEKQVLKGVDLSVPQGSVFGFIGRNGAGKTTTMKCVLGLCSLDEGSIEVMREKVTFGQTNTNRHIGYLPDVPEFYGFMTPKEYLLFCAELGKMEKGRGQVRVDELLHLVGLEKEKRKIKGFSRGMKQRLGIAQALLLEPKLLICDEPTSALDPVGRKEILDILRSVKEQTTVLFSTHILSDVERICDEVAFLEEGVIRYQGKITDLKKQNPKREFEVQTVKEADAEMLFRTFEGRRLDTQTLLFTGDEGYMLQVLGYIVKKGILLQKAERKELDLETLFLEGGGV